jgi:hypothetical protein
MSTPQRGYYNYTISEYQGSDRNNSGRLNIIQKITVHQREAKYQRLDKNLPAKSADTNVEEEQQKCSRDCHSAHIWHLATESEYQQPAKWDNSLSTKVLRRLIVHGQMTDSQGSFCEAFWLW